MSGPASTCWPSAIDTSPPPAPRPPPRGRAGWAVARRPRRCRVRGADRLEQGHVLLSGKRAVGDEPAGRRVHPGEEPDRADHGIFGRPRATGGGAIM